MTADGRMGLMSQLSRPQMWDKAEQLCHRMLLPKTLTIVGGIQWTQTPRFKASV